MPEDAVIGDQAAHQRIERGHVAAWPASRPAAEAVRARVGRIRRVAWAPKKQRRFGRCAVRRRDGEVFHMKAMRARFWSALGHEGAEVSSRQPKTWGSLPKPTAPRTRDTDF